MYILKIWISVSLGLILRMIYRIKDTTLLSPQYLPYVFREMGNLIVAEIELIGDCASIKI